MEKMARNRLATSLLAVNTFFTKGGKMMMRIDPIIQKKLMAQIARNNLGMCMVIPISRQDDRSTLWSIRSEEHTSELQSLMRISYAVFCLKKKKKKTYYIHNTEQK